MLKNFKKVVARGRVNKDAAPCVETYNIVVDEIFEKDEELYDRKVKFKDIMKGDLVNWPKSFVHFLKV